MDCRACTDAEIDPRRYDYLPQCDSCMARALAATGAHIESRDSGGRTAHFQSVLKKCFSDRWVAGERLVLDWARKINITDKRKAMPT